MGLEVTLSSSAAISHEGFNVAWATLNVLQESRSEKSDGE